MNTKLFKNLLLVSVLFVWTPPGLYSQRESIIDDNIRHYQERAEKYMIKNDTLFSWFTIDSIGVSMFESPLEKENQTPEFAVTWQELHKFMDDAYSLPIEELMAMYTANFTSAELKMQYPQSHKDYPPTILKTKSDTGIGTMGEFRIAIDPGHVGGSEEFARMEKKYIRMKPGAAGNAGEIAFNEGNLTMATAFALSDSLRDKGIVNVMLTRNGYGLTAFGKSFEDWLKEDYPAALEDYIRDRELDAEEEKSIRLKTKPNEIFHTVFKHAEFEERQRKIREFRPHLILAIHYNVEESNNSDREGFYKPVKNNFCMTFVPGAWAEGEFDLRQWRFQFLVNLLSPDFESSVSFSDKVTKSFVSRLKVPAAGNDSSLKYLRDYSIPLTTHPATGEKIAGVFARNLAFNRMVYGTLCFGETLYQDNVSECISLNQRTLNYHGWMGPPRVAESASAYLSGILNFIQETGSVEK